MPLSDKDRAIWRIAMQNVTPMISDQVPLTTNSSVKINRESNVKHTWDLPGMTLMDAHAKVNSEIDQARQSFKYMTFITGKSGTMQKEFPDWVRNMQGIRSCEPINGGGAFRISFKKARHNKK